MSSPVRMLVLDVDGVMTDGRIHYSSEGESLKSFHAHDGYGLRLLMKAGIGVGVISGRTSAPLVRRMNDLGIRFVRLACKDKNRAMHDLSSEAGVDLRHIAYMGDDLIDIPAFRLAGRKLAPANAVPEIREMADYVTSARGGHGAIREICDLLLEEAGVDVIALAEGEMTQ